MAWHINFQRVPELPEKLVAGRQKIYFRYFLDANDASDADVAHYAESYTAPGHLHAGFEIYRAFPVNAEFNIAQRSRIDVPIVLAAGEKSFAKYLPTVAQALHKHGCESVKTEVIHGGSHYVAEEQPRIVTDLIEKYASSEQQ
jgi:pimeloyl-ACP methyl ester carboxylesterase